MDHVPHHLIDGCVDFVVGLGARVGEGSPAESGWGANHDGGGSGETAAMPPGAGSVVANHPAAGVACVSGWVGGGGGGHELDGCGLEEGWDVGRAGDVVEELDELRGGGDPAGV